MPDAITPSLTSLYIPDSVDISTGASTLTIAGTVRDNSSSVLKVVVWLDDDITFSSSPSSASWSNYSFLGNYGIYDSWSDGVSRQTYGISEFNVPGIYTVSRVTVENEIGNTQTYGTTKLASMGINTKIEVIGNTPDTTAPRLTSLHIPDRVDISAGASTLTISGTALDDLSGVSKVVVWLEDDITFSSSASSSSYSNYSFLGNYGIYDSWSDGVSEQTYGISEFNVTGVYTVSRVTVEDETGNTQTYGTAKLASMGINTEIEIIGNTPDTTAPSLTSLHIPDSVDISAGTSTLTISGTAHDDLSGVSKVVVWLDNNITFSSSTNSTSYSNYSFLGNYGIYDSWSDGVSSQTYGVSEFNVPGIYKIERVTVEDEVGNTQTYGTAKLASMGINTDIEVVGKSRSASESQASVSNKDAFIISEGTETYFNIDFENLSDDLVSYTYRFSTEGGTASANDFKGGVGAGSFSIISNVSQDRSVSIPFSALRDSRAEDQETLYLEVELSGVTFSNGHSRARYEVVIKNNERPEGDVLILGTPEKAETLEAEASGLSDADGLGRFSYQWLRDGAAIKGATSKSYTLGQNDVGAAISAKVSYIDGQGAAESVVSSKVIPTTIDLNLIGDAGDNVLRGSIGNDTLTGGDGSDTLIGGAGDDKLVGGSSSRDLRDNIYGGSGNDTIDGGYGNDELRGNAGDDSIAGGFGADTVIGGSGNDTLTGSAFGDLIFGGDGLDFINGGFGSDRVNGGNGGDRFFHLGIADHGSDWIQDYDAAEGDLLLFGGNATRDQFQINIANTANAGAGGVGEAFVIYRPTGQIIWALVDGDGQDQINLSVGGQVYDLIG